MPGVTGPPREDGWYRLTERGWVRVPDAEAELEQSAGSGWDLVRVEFGAAADVPLF